MHPLDPSTGLRMSGSGGMVLESSVETRGLSYRDL